MDFMINSVKSHTQNLSNPLNKANLAEFLSESWCEVTKVNLSQGHQLVLACGFRIGTRTVSIMGRRSEELKDLDADHEEADTRLSHAKHAVADHQRIILQSPNTGVLIVCVHFSSSIPCGRLWFETGGKDKHRFIPVHKIASRLGIDCCTVLLGVHDTTSVRFVKFPVGG